MTTTTTSAIDIIEADAQGIVSVRRADTTTDDVTGVATTSYHRWTLVPGQDISAQWPAVQAKCNETWTPEVIAAYQASLPPPPNPRTISRREFLNRFASAERIAIRKAAEGRPATATSPAVEIDEIARDFYDLLGKVDGGINLDNSDTINGTNYCESKGYIGPGRAAQILT